jgi:DNA polymerase-3 subunit epsilon
MNLKLFYDTETTGLPDFKAPSESAHQPHIVQLAALLVDMDTRETIQSMDVIIRPDGWTIPEEVAAVHGITTEHAAEVGIPESMAVSMFMELWSGRNRVAHNQQFDPRIVRIALMRYVDTEAADIWKEGAAECTAIMAAPICQLPPTAKMVRAGFNKFKTPNLGEAYRHFTGNELVNAHSAMADVLACRDVYFAIKGAQE